MGFEEMLTITDLESRGIIVTEAEKRRFGTNKAIERKIEMLKPPKVPCQVCGELTRIIFEYNNLDNCASCCGGMLKAQRLKDVRAMPPPSISGGSIKEAERNVIESVMRRGESLSASAVVLGICTKTLSYKLKEYGIERHGAGIKIDDGQAGSEICDVHERREAC